MSAKKAKPAATPGTAGPGTASGLDHFQAERVAERFASRVDRYVEMQLARRAPDAEPSEVVGFALECAKRVEHVEHELLATLLAPAVTEDSESPQPPWWKASSVQFLLVQETKLLREQRDALLELLRANEALNDALIQTGVSRNDVRATEIPNWKAWDAARYRCVPLGIDPSRFRLIADDGTGGVA